MDDTGCSHGPTISDKTISAAWRFCSLHLSRKEAQYLTTLLATGVTRPDVYDSLRRLSHPPAPALQALDRNGTIIYGVACPLPALVKQW